MGLNIESINTKNFKMKTTENGYEFHLFDEYSLLATFKRKIKNKEEIVDALVDFDEYLITKFINPFDPVNKNILGNAIMELFSIIKGLSND